MSKMGQMFFEVQELAHMGIPNDSIATQLSLPIEMVDEIVQQYSFGGFDGMIDMAYSSCNWLLPDGSMEPAASKGTEGNKGTVPGFATDCPQPGAVLCNSGLKYVFTSRGQSDEERAKDRETVCKYYGIEDDPSKAPCRVYCENMGDYLDGVIWRYYREHNMA